MQRCIARDERLLNEGKRAAAGRGGWGLSDRSTCAFEARLLYTVWGYVARVDQSPTAALTRRFSPSGPLWIATQDERDDDG